MAGPEPEPDAGVLLEGEAALQAYPSVEVLPPTRRRLPLVLVQDDDDGKGLHACRRKDVSSAQESRGRSMLLSPRRANTLLQVAQGPLLY